MVGQLRRETRRGAVAGWLARLAVVPDRTGDAFGRTEEEAGLAARTLARKGSVGRLARAR
jgi:hypothetical protein